MSDGELLSDETLTLKVYKDAIKIHLGRNITDVPVDNGNKFDAAESSDG